MKNTKREKRSKVNTIKINKKFFEHIQQRNQLYNTPRKRYKMHDYNKRSKILSSYQKEFKNYGYWSDDKIKYLI